MFLVQFLPFFIRLCQRTSNFDSHERTVLRKGSANCLLVLCRLIWEETMTYIPYHTTFDTQGSSLHCPLSDEQLMRVVSSYKKVHGSVLSFTWLVLYQLPSLALSHQICSHSDLLWVGNRVDMLMADLLLLTFPSTFVMCILPLPGMFQIPF